MKKIRIAILGSTRGSILPKFFQLLNESNTPAEIAIVLSNKTNAGILKKADDLGIKYHAVPIRELNRDHYDKQITHILEHENIDLIVLIGYMRIISADFVQHWKNRIINTHPSLLPAHAGLMDIAVHQAALDNHDKQSGCTVHLVTEQVDAGPILVQKTCPVLPEDDATLLKQRVQALEAPALVEAIQKIAQTVSKENYESTNTN